VEESTVFRGEKTEAFDSEEEFGKAPILVKAKINVPKGEKWCKKGGHSLPAERKKKPCACTI